MVIMKVILTSIYNFLENIGRVRAATHLAQSGDYAGAKRVMMEDFKGWI
jgi:hypothetical protein